MEYLLIWQINALIKYRHNPNNIFTIQCFPDLFRGKFGSVYKCIDKATGKTWAAKILKCRDSDKKKIWLEIEIMNQLKHPKILMLWDAFDAPRKMILIME